MNLEQGLATQSKTGETIETLKEMVEKQFQMIEMQAKMIDKQGQEIDKLKRREAQLDMWREQTHDALDFLLWEREGPNKGAYRNKVCFSNNGSSCLMLCPPSMYTNRFIIPDLGPVERAR